MALIWIVGVGYRWTVIDTALKPSHPIYPPSAVPHPDHGLPGEAPPHASTQPIPPGHVSTQPIPPPPSGPVAPPKR
jgi:hypothetical protein